MSPRLKNVAGVELGTRLNSNKYITAVYVEANSRYDCVNEVQRATGRRNADTEPPIGSLISKGGLDLDSDPEPPGRHWTV